MRKIFKRILISVLLALNIIILVGCGIVGASEGYALRERELKEYYLNLSGSDKTIEYTSCSYVCVIREGYSDTYFYKASYTINIGTNNYDYVEYFAWIEGTASTEDSSQIAYDLAYEHVQTGKTLGKVGTL